MGNNCGRRHFDSKGAMAPSPVGCGANPLRGPHRGLMHLGVSLGATLASQTVPEPHPYMLVNDP